MSFTVSYYCPHCGAVAELERDEYLADKAVTSTPFEGWSYATPDEEYESADGVRFVCGAGDSDRLSWHPRVWERGDDGEPFAVDDGGAGEDSEARSEEGAVGCGRHFYLSFVRFAGGRELDPRTPAEHVTLSDGARGPSGPRGPPGPGSSR